MVLLEKQKANAVSTYKKYAAAVAKTLADEEFYDNLFDVFASGNNEIEFSNKKIEMAVDTKWIDAIEEAVQALQDIIASPRAVIKEEELIVNIANAKKSGPDTVRHLAQNGALIDEFNETEGTVRPNKLMQKLREDTVGIYENALTFTVLEFAHNFVKIRHDAIFDAVGDEIGTRLKVTSELENNYEHINVTSSVNIRKKDNILETDAKNEEAFSRISRLHRVLGLMMGSSFAEEMEKENRVKGEVVMTNVLKRNPKYNKIVKLWGFLRQYDEVGYSIKIVEEEPEIDEYMLQNIFNNQLLQYISLKGYMKDESDFIDIAESEAKEKTLKPKFVHKIVEELTEDYDLPEIEIRKILIEELTKEQLMAEEEAERLRLVEEAEAKRLAEEAILNEQLKLEEIEREKNERHERLMLENEDRQRAKVYIPALLYFSANLDEQLATRNLVMSQLQHGAEDLASADEILAAIEERKQGERERIAKVRAEERERQEKENLEKEREAREIAERKAKIEEELKRKDLEALEKADILKIEIYKNALQVFLDNRSDNIALREKTVEDEVRKRAKFDEERRMKRRRKTIRK